MDDDGNSPHGASGLHCGGEFDYLSASEAAARLGDDGGRLLLQGHVAGELTLLGYREDKSQSSNVHEPIPQHVFAGAMRLNLRDDSVEVDATTKDFVAFERRAKCRWEEVAVRLDEVERLKKSHAGATLALANAKTDLL